jgi:hypothetical protein
MTTEWVGITTSPVCEVVFLNAPLPDFVILERSEESKAGNSVINVLNSPHLQ